MKTIIHIYKIGESYLVRMFTNFFTLVLPLQGDIKQLHDDFASKAGQGKFSLQVEFSLVHSLQHYPPTAKKSGSYLNKKLKFTHLAPGSTIYLTCTQQIFNR